MHHILRVVALFFFCNVANISWAVPKIPNDESIRQAYGDEGVLRIAQWRELIKQLQSAPNHVKLEQVNDFFNRLAFVDDIDIWGEDDYWATPVEFLGVGAGDCEDYTMAKYQTLRMMGVPDAKMRLNYVKYLPYEQFHMVLTYTETTDSMPLVLDNILTDIVPASQRSDLAPIYSFNGNNLWISRLVQDGQRVGSSNRLSMWEEWMVRLDSGALRTPVESLITVK